MILDDLAAATRARVERKKQEVPFERVKQRAIALAEQERAFSFPFEKAIGKKVFAISAIAKKGVFDCLLEVNKYITRDRKRKDEDVSEEQIVVANKPWSPL